MSHQRNDFEGARKTPQPFAYFTLMRAEACAPFAQGVIKTSFQSPKCTDFFQAQRAAASSTQPNGLGVPHKSSGLKGRDNSDGVVDSDKYSDGI